MSSKAERKQARANHRAAKHALHANKDREETPEYLELNDRANATAKRVGWLFRG